MKSLNNGMKVYLRDDLQNGEYYNGISWAEDFMVRGEWVVVMGVEPTTKSFLIENRFNTLEYSYDMI